MPTWSFEEVRAPDPAADAPEALIEVVVATVERTQTNVLMKRLHSALLSPLQYAFTRTIPVAEVGSPYEGLYPLALCASSVWISLFSIVQFPNSACTSTSSTYSNG